MNTPTLLLPTQNGHFFPPTYALEKLLVKLEYKQTKLPHAILPLIEGRKKKKSPCCVII